MRTSATGCSKVVRASSDGRGFTLLEMLVTLAIIGMAVSTVVIALYPDPSALVSKEAQRLAALLELASEESALIGMPLAWIGRDDGYEFQARELAERGPDWGVVRGDEHLRPRRLPSGIYIARIRVDGQEWAPGKRVLLDPQGAQELSVEITLGHARARVTGAGGRFQASLSSGGGT
ncbi:MAG TPA: prepilin-type N-terminal cleavage/methylation domain-containing protein [Thiobacillaceae bacterium]|nr:prepilin-type N-terminal cleavage/methylation domain-containing protein [Thiobacillaceae bacterium]HNU64073.1 prepilin-type N-terminal cleavage/methylation domain-containing protein [Thiobacillaceae bacterium]